MLIGISTVALAQDSSVTIKKSDEKVKISGQVFYIHQVKKGETVYSLCKAYEITKEQLVEFNPQVAEGLKEGQSLKIPEKIVRADAAKSQPNAKASVTHEVKRKETLYSIANQYGVTVEAILRANPTIGGQINKGQLITIPSSESMAERSSESKAAVSDTFTYYSVKQGETLFGIAKAQGVSEDELRRQNTDAFRNGELMEGAVLRIPPRKLAASANSTPEARPLNKPSATSSYRYSKQDVFRVALLLPFSSNADEAKNYLQFYEGALLAVDSLKREGVSLHINTFDVYDGNSLTLALKDPSLAEANLIIGPVHQELLPQVADVAKQYSIPIVYPNLSDSPSEELLADNPYIIPLKVPNNVSTVRLLEGLCPAPNRNIILVRLDGVDTATYNTYKAFLDSQHCKYTPLTYTLIRSQETFSQHLSSSQENHVIVAFNSSTPISDYQASILDFMNTLNALSFKQKSAVYAYGASSWKKISAINVGHFYALNFRITQPFFIDYSSDATKRFIAAYRYYYKGEPTNYSFYGYDTALYFLQSLKNYGTNLMPYLVDNEKELLQSKFKFRKSENEGLENIGVYLLEYTPSFDIIRK